MPNPFPGMDPYLEGPLWTTVQSSLIVEIARQLAPKLRSKYSVLPQERIILAVPDPLETPSRFRIPEEVPMPYVEPDVLLDLQQALQSIYECFSYDRVADHSGQPPVRLAADQQAWADERLRAAGLRS
jgi:hypothetical protein